jgi:hypothetical protein
MLHNFGYGSKGGALTLSATSLNVDFAYALDQAVNMELERGMAAWSDIDGPALLWDDLFEGDLTDLDNDDPLPPVPAPVPCLSTSAAPLTHPTATPTTTAAAAVMEPAVIPQPSAPSGHPSARTLRAKKSDDRRRAKQKRAQEDWNLPEPPHRLQKAPKVLQDVRAYQVSYNLKQLPLANGAHIAKQQAFEDMPAEGFDAAAYLDKPFPSINGLEVNREMLSTASFKEVNWDGM